MMTKKLSKADELELLMFGSSIAIPRQERRGQGEFVESETLPRIQSGWENEDSRPVLEKLGIEILGEADDLFYNVNLPEGWSKVAEDHAMWSKLVDDRGYERAAIFYKAAFYDRKAHIGLLRRFSYGAKPVHGWDEIKTSPIVAMVTDGGKAIWVTEPMTPSEGRDSYTIMDILENQAKLWLEERFPNYKDVYAYWD